MREAKQSSDSGDDKTKTILIVATLDTKGMEVEFARKQIEGLGARVLLMDAGILGKPAITPDITREEVALAIGLSIEEVRKMPAEAEALSRMTEGAGRIARRLADDRLIHGGQTVTRTRGSSDYPRCLFPAPATSLPRLPVR